jgi:PadR family transcriptional regulator PadR
MLNKDLVAASSTPLVLSILAKSESYGYDILQQIRVLSNDQMTWSDGMLYPLLHRLEKKGLISSEWRKSESGRKRKYYRINSDGKTALQREKLQWKIVNNTLGKLWEASCA